MIVPAMNTVEIMSEMFLDLPSVLHKHQVGFKNARRSAIKAKNKTYYKYWEYKSPRRNDWTVIFKSTPSLRSTVYAVHYLNKQGVNVMVVNLQLQGSFYHYSGHFLERYNERFLNQQGISRIEIFRNYIHHNSLSVCEQLFPEDTEIKRVMIKINQGIAFGTYEENEAYKITDFKTFISNDMILKFQKEDVISISNCYEEYCSENPRLQKMQKI